MELEYDLVLDANVIYDAKLHRSFGGSNGILTETAGALCIVIFALRGGWLFLVAGLLLMIAPPVLLYQAAKREAARLEDGGRVHCQMSEEGIRWMPGRGGCETEAGETGFISWENVQKAESTAKSLLLTIDQKQVLILPKRDLGDLLSNGIEMISTHMAPERVNIRM